MTSRRRKPAKATAVSRIATAEPILAIARSAISSDKAADRLRAILGAGVFRAALPGRYLTEPLP